MMRRDLPLPSTSAYSGDLREAPRSDVTGRTLRVVIPAKNEEARIGETVASFSEHFGDRASILVVANACSDRTAAIVREIGERYPTVQLLEIAAPIGKGGAVRAGLATGDEPYLAFVDADGSTVPAELDRLLAYCRTTGVSGAIGSRWLPGSSISRRQPLQRRIASRCFNLLVRSMFGLPYADTQCGAKVFERTAIDRVLNKLELANFAFDVDLLLQLKRLGCHVTEIPIAWGDVPDYSKVVLVRSGSSMALALLRLWIRDGALRHLPWTDLLARSSVIPVDHGVMFLVISRTARRTEATQSFVEEIVRQGHIVTERRVNSVFDAIAFAWSYARRGHRTYQVLVDLLRPNGTFLTSLSTKPTVSATTIAALGREERALLVERLADRCGYSTFFRRVDRTWSLSAARVETLLQESL